MGERVNLATADLFHAEIARLQVMNVALHEQGHALAKKLMLTEEELQAVAWAEQFIREEAIGADGVFADVLKGLLERLGGE